MAANFNPGKYDPDKWLKAARIYDEDLLPATDLALTFKGVNGPTAVKLLGDSSAGAKLSYDYSDNAVTIQVPASKRTKLVDVVQVELAPLERTRLEKH